MNFRLTSARSEALPSLRATFVLAFLSTLSIVALGQSSAPATTPTSSAPVSYASIAALDDLLPKLEQTATVTSTDLTRLHIEKWKVDAENRRQAQGNANSVVKNMQSALPGMIAEVRAHPDDVAANFKLYRNLTALYDVMAQVTELTGAFGAKSEYEALQTDFNTLETLRRQLADRVADLADKQQSELTDLRNQIAAARAAIAAATPPPPIKKTVVDDNPPPAAPAKAGKKAASKTTKPAKPQATTPVPAAPQNPK